MMKKGNGGFFVSNLKIHNSKWIISLMCCVFAFVFFAQPVHGAGVTIITHGQATPPAGLPTWEAYMGNAIKDRIVAELGGAASWTDVGVTITNAFSPSRLGVSVLRYGNPGTATSGEFVIRVDWTDASLYDWGTASIASNLAAVLTDASAVPGWDKPLGELPIQLIGHSRGGSVIAVLARLLGEKGIWVDQTTTLDPHPRCGLEFSDPDVNIPSNVLFADNYWQQIWGTANCGTLDPRGFPIDGAYNRELTNLSGGNSLLHSHSDVHLWYHGTIDLATPATDGEQTIDSTMRSTWWTTAEQQGAKAGFYYSRIVGRPRPSAGLGLYAGNAARVPVTKTGDPNSRWPNVADIKILDNRFLGSNPQFTIGESLPMSYVWEDESSGGASVTVFLDSDQNPYNGKSAQIYYHFSGNTGGTAYTNQFTWNTLSTPAGTYYLCAMVRNGAHTRYAYAPKPITLVTANTQQGSNLALDAQNWDDSVGNANGVIEGRENVSLRIRLRNNGTITVNSVEATLSSSVGTMNITGAHANYPNITAGSSQWGGYMYMNLNQDSYNNAPFTIHVTYEKGGLPYYQDLTFTQTFYQQGSRVPVFQMDHVVFDDSAQGNGDGVLQSGEEADVTVYLKNTGNADASKVKAYLANPSNPEFDVGGLYIKQYPDLPAGGAAQGPTNGKFFVRRIPTTFTGVVNCDIIVMYSDLEIAATNNYPLFSVQPARWMSIGPEQWDFGVTGTDSNVVTMLNVSNTGSDVLHVSSITTSSSDTTLSGNLPPWDIPIGGSSNVTVTINTTNLQGSISREVTVNSNARIPQKKMVITGLVSDGPPLFRVPNADNGSLPDASGNLIVYGKGADIYAFDLASGTNFPVYVGLGEQSLPRVSGNLVAWEEFKGTGSDGEITLDVFARDLSSGQIFAVATNETNERLVGVDGTRVAFVRADYMIPSQEIHEGDGQIRNLYVFDLQTGETSKLTDYQLSGHDTVWSVDEGDYGGGVLVWTEGTYSWLGSYWDSDQPKRMWKFEPGLDPSPVLLPITERTYTPTANNGQIAWTQKDIGWPYSEQVWLWVNSSAEKLTSEQTDHGYPALGTGLTAYNKSSVDGLFFWNIGTDSESVLTTMSSYSDWRMDGRLVVSRVDSGSSNGIYYAFLNQPEIGISSSDLTLSNAAPMESQAFDLTSAIHNLTAISQTNNLTVRLYDGNPDAGGLQIGTDRVITGGIAGRGQAQVTFSNIVFNTEGTHQLYVRVFVPGGDNPGNNTAFVSVTVQDSDTTGPVISGVTAQEYGGDGDGMIGADEQVRIAYSLTDASGIASTMLLVDGSPVSVTASNGNYWAITGPLIASNHVFEIRATDADDSPASTSNLYSFTVVPAELIAVLYNGAPVVNNINTVINFGTLEAGTTPSHVFVVRNDGLQILSLGSLSVSGGFSNSAPSQTGVAAGDFAYFSVLPASATVGSFTGVVSLVNSDLARTPYTFKVASRVVDTTAPVVAFTNPTFEASYLTTNASVDISGVAYDNVSVTQVAWSNDRGSQSGVCSGTTTWSKNGIALFLGTNAITVAATDGVGNIGSNRLVVTYALTPVAGFTASPTNGAAPLTVTFTDTSTGTITDRFWNFGDGSSLSATSTVVAHTYGLTGTNIVTLIVSGPTGVSTNTCANCIVVNNAPPTVSITTPVNGAILNAPTNLTVAATAWDTNGVSQLRIIADATNTLGISSSSPLNVVWTNAPTGPHSLSALAVDTLGATGVSATVNIIVNGRPAVDAGTNQLITLPVNTAALRGIASDDPWPSNTLTFAWSKISGSGTVSFASPNSTNTTATFSTNGVYVLRLTVNDGAATTNDDMTVTVNMRPSVNAGTAQVVTLPSSATLSGTVNDDGLPSGSVAVNWSKVSGTGSVSFGSPNSTNTTATFSTNGVYVLRLTASDGVSSNSSTATVTANARPVIDPLPAVTNGVTTVNDTPVVKPDEPVCFTVGTFDADGDTLSCLWDFGDGATSTDCNPCHVFTNCGPIVVTNIVTDGYALVMNTLTVSVACAFTEPVKLTMKSNFAPGKLDSATLKAYLYLPLGLDVTNRQATLDVGGVPVLFTLNAKGRATNGHSTLKLAHKGKKTSTVWQVTATLKGDWDSDWVDDGLVNATTNTTVTVPVLLLFDSDPPESFFAEKALHYKAKARKSGTAK